MKKLLRQLFPIQTLSALVPCLVTCLVLCLAVGCNDDSPEPADPPTPPVPEDTITFPADIDLNPVFSDEGGEKTFSFTASGAWTAAVTESRAASDWLTVAPASGEAGAATITVTAQSNETDEDRSAVVTLKSGLVIQGIPVTQMHKGALVAAPGSYTVDNAGEDITIEVSHNVDFEIAIDGDWITQITSRALTTESLVFRVAENPGYDNREGKITFTSKDRTLTQEVKIYQAQTDALVVSTTDYVFDEKIYLFDIEVRANVDFTVENPDVVWLHQVETRGLTTHTLHYRIDENTLYDSRSAEIRIVDTADNLSQTITVTQMQKDAIVVAKSRYTVGQAGEDVTIQLGHNVDFDVEIGQPWITQIQTRGLVTENLLFRVAENPEQTSRETTIVFLSKDHETRQTVTVVQEGLPDEEAIVRAYLVKLYRDTDGDHWRNNRNWCSDKPINWWEGVTYSEGNLSLDFSYAGNNLRGTIDLSGCTALTFLNCYKNQLTSLNVSGCTALTYLTCKYNQLTSLNVSNCTALIVLMCQYNQLTNLNISGCMTLTDLECCTNPLTKLDVSDYPTLTELDCRDNQLTSLDVSNNMALIYLDCRDNQLTSLDVSNNTALTKLYCDNNQLTRINNLSNCKALIGVSSCENKICQEIPSFVRANDLIVDIDFGWDDFNIDGYRYEYYQIWDEVLNKRVTRYRDLGVGWWYPGEPGSLHNDW